MGEDSGSATVRWCGCGATQLNKHTYAMQINVPSRNDTRALQNLPEKIDVFIILAVETMVESNAADTADRHESGSRQTWPPH